MSTKTPHGPASQGHQPADNPNTSAGRAGSGPHPKRRPGRTVVLRQAKTRRRHRRTVLGVGVVVAVLGVVTAMMLSSRPTISAATRAAPGFTLSTTDGRSVSLSAYKGKNVILYFSEGAGCGSCLQQMAAIEKDQAAFDKANVTVLPIVMNTRDQIMHDMNTYGVKTAFLLDDGTVSKQYGTLGKGMHAGLPGHSFVLVDKSGTQRWYGEYPSMFLAPADLLNQVQKHLAA